MKSKQFQVALGTLAVFFAASALAQQDQGPELEEVVVTGSYLYTGADSPSPVSVLSGEDMVAYAPPDLVSFFINNVPQNFEDDIGSQIENDGQSRARSDRNATINLRGLGDMNTLVVLNGRRTITYPSPTGTGWYRTAINSLVPRIAVQRTELLLDGGSAIFGSDAVAGVVNFVTRDDFRGFDLSVDSRSLEEATDAKNVTVSAIFGAGNDDTSIILAGEFHQEDLVEIIDVSPVFDDFLANPDVSWQTGFGLEPVDSLEFRNAGGGARYVDPDCGNPAFGNALNRHWLIDDQPLILDSAVEAPDYASATACGRPYDTGLFDDAGRLLNNNVKQINLFARAEHNFSDALRVNAEFGVSRQRYGDIDQWGDNGSNGWLVEQNALGPEFAIAANHPGLARAQMLQPGFGMGQPIFARDETLPFLSEMSAFNQNDVFRAAFGVEGDINANWTWMVDTSASYSDLRAGVRDVVLDRYPLAISGLGGPDCLPDSGTPGMGSCYFYNPFMSAALPDAAQRQTNLSQTGLANNQEMLEWLIPLRTDVFEAELFTLDLRVMGEFGDLPGGPIGLAAGVAYREEEVGRDADAMVNAGEMATLGVFNDFRGRQQVDSVYFELALPVHEDVNIQVAGRQEEYDIGFSEFSPKIAALWTVNDRLTLRGSWGTSFKGPSISHVAAETIFTGMGPPTTTVGGTTYGMGPGTGFIYISRPNTNLEPQTSDNISFGADFIVNERISVGGALVQLNIEDLIVSTTANNVLSQCYVRAADGTPFTQTGGSMSSLMYPVVGPDGSKCVGSVIDTDPSLYFDVDGDGVLDTTRQNIATLLNSPVNIGYIDTQFLDLNANMNFDTPIGALNFRPALTFTLQYDFPLGGIGGRDGLCSEGVCSGVGRSFGMGFNGVTDMPHWQGVFPVTVNRNNHNFRVIARYRDGLNEAIEDLSRDDFLYRRFERDEGMWTVDFNYAYQFEQGSSLALSVYNLFATDPPAQDAQRFNQRRREIGVQFRHSFDTN
jgi:iron complex outermembrane receptor protein